MAVLVKGLGDRNVALKKTYASSLGHLVRVAKETSVTKLLETLENRYLEADDEGGRLACMHTMQVGFLHWLFHGRSLIFFYSSVGDGSLQSGRCQESFQSECTDGILRQTYFQNSR